MDFSDAAKIFGPSGALLLFALLTNYWGMWATKPNIDAVVKGKDERIASQAAALEAAERRLAVETEQLRRERDAMEATLRGERDRALTLALEGWDRAQHVLDLNGVPKPSPVPRRRSGRESGL